MAIQKFFSQTKLKVHHMVTFGCTAYVYIVVKFVAIFWSISASPTAPNCRNFNNRVLSTKITLNYYYELTIREA